MQDQSTDKPANAICAHCGIAFFARPARLNLGQGRFHSADCYHASQRVVPDTKTCSRCGLHKPATAYYVNKHGFLEAPCAACQCELAAIRQGRITTYRPRTHYDDLPGWKTCRKCNRSQPLASFHRQLDGALGRSSRCKDCSNRYRIEYLLRHGTEVRARARARWPARREDARRRASAYYLAHAAEIKARVRAYSRERPELIRQRTAAYRRAHPEKVHVWRKAWKRRNPDSLRDTLARRRARVRGQAPRDHVDYRFIRQRDKWKCWLCHKKIQPKDLHYDHAIAIAKGGDHSTENIRMAHRWCNQRKSAKLIQHQPYML